MKPDILKALGLTDGEVVMEYDLEYPECVDMVVLRDVSPSKMDKVCDIIRKAGNEELRLCASIIDKLCARRFDGLSAKQAFDLSWDYSVATVRMG